MRNARLNGDLFLVAPVNVTANVRVLALGVFAYDDDVEISGLASAQRTLDARQKPGWTEVDILPKPLPDRHDQAPNGDVVGSFRPSNRAQQDCVVLAEEVESVVRHHPSVPRVVLGAPGQVRLLELSQADHLGRGIKYVERGGSYLAADPVARYDGNPVVHSSRLT